MRPPGLREGPRADPVQGGGPRPPGPRRGGGGARAPIGGGGAFPWGDSRRGGAPAPFAPARGSVLAWAGAGGLVLGFCSGFRVLGGAPLRRGALLVNPNRHFTLRQVRLEVVNA